MNKIKITTNATSLCRTRPCMIITTLHENGVVNAGTFGAYTNVGPKQIGIAIGAPTDTYRNIKRDGEFVINIPSIEHAAALQTCGMNPPHDVSELDLAKLTAEPASIVKVPLIAECVANIECRYWKELEIGYHNFVVGEVLCGHLREDLVDSDGFIDVVKARVAFGIRYPEPVFAVLGQVKRVPDA